MSRDDPARAVTRPIIWRWTDAMDAELEQRFKAGEPVKTIAFAMDLPDYTIGTRIDYLRDLGRLPYRNRRWSAGETRQLLAMRDADTSYAACAAALGRTRGSCKEEVYRVRREQARDDQDQLQLELQAA